MDNVEIIRKDIDRPAMDIIDDSTLKLIDQLAKRMVHGLSLSRVDYDLGLISFDFTHNLGKDDEFVTKNELSVGVSNESVPCMIWEISNAIFNQYVI